MNVICQKCGSSTTDQFQFCTNCGEDLTPLAQSKCPFCSSGNPSGVQTCSSCGRELKRTNPINPYQKGQMKPQGVALLSISEVMLGALSIIIGLTSLSIGGTLPDPSIMDALPQFLRENAVMFFSFIGVIGFVHGAISLLLSYGYWTARYWSWKTGLAFSIYSMAFSPLLYLIAGEVLITVFEVLVPLMFNTVIIYYLTRPHMKQYFIDGRFDRRIER